jgi:MFS family permease
MMTPVGRLVLVRTIEKRDLVNAMAWVTVPALIGPVVGPPLGGFITTYASWHWIFIINVPIGLAGIYLVTRYIDPVPVEHVAPFDGTGLVLAGLGVAGLAFGLSVAGLDMLPWWVVTALVAGGAVFMTAYVLYSRRVAAPVLDFALLQIPTFRASVVGGFLFRLGIGALPFLLPLMLQTGFGFNPLQSGLITFSAAIGALGMKTLAAPLINAFGFRRILVGNALISSVFLAAVGLFTPATPIYVVLAILLIGGFFRSLQFTANNTLAYADIDVERMSRATAMAAVGQQLSLATGVAVGALAVEMTLRWNGETEITASSFAPAFVAVAVISALSVFVFARLPADAGAVLSGKVSAKTADSSDQRI